jgi:hypothetical protein
MHGLEVGPETSVNNIDNSSTMLTFTGNKHVFMHCEYAKTCAKPQQ